MSRAQLKVDDVRESEQTSAVVCQEATEVEAGEKCGLRDLCHVVSIHTRRPHLPMWSVSMCVLVCLPALPFLQGPLGWSLRRSSTLVPPAGFTTVPGYKGQLVAQLGLLDPSTRQCYRRPRTHKQPSSAHFTSNTLRSIWTFYFSSCLQLS